MVLREIRFIEISKVFLINLDQHISSINSVVRVQLAQRRIRNNDNNRGGFNNRGGRNNWNNGPSRPGGNNRWNNSRGGGGFRGKS